MTHTPTPWTWDKRGENLNGSDGTRVIVYASGLSLSGLPDETSVANSRLIVTAVNAFEPMREALKALDDYWSNPDDGYETPDSKRSKAVFAPDTIKIWKQIRGAIALADK